MDRRPTVCQTLHSLHIGGGEILARAFALEHAGEFRPVFALLDDLGDLGAELRNQGYRVEVIGRRPGFDPQCVRRLGQFLRRENVSLIHAHQYGPLLYSALARLPSRRIPILLTEHGRDYPDFRRWKRVWANRLLLTRRDRFVAVGQGVREALVNYEGFAANRVDVIYNGSDMSAYSPERPLRAEVRRELGLANEAFVVIQVARLNRLKDHATSLRAIARLIKIVPNVNFVLVGDGEERPKLEKLTADLALRESVQFLGSRSDVPRLLQAADAFLLSSISEGIPLTLLEAMATGLPCVATRVGGVTEVVHEGQTGLLADAGDDARLAEALDLLAKNPDLRAKMGREGRARAVEKFSSNVMQMRYRALYQEMATPLGSNSRTAPS